ncbi:MAG: SPFH domain-containing protein, partial [Cyanobacteria bacterium J06632_19]
MEQLFLLISLALGGSALAGSVKIINQGNEALVERLGSYNNKLEPGLNFMIPFFDRVVLRETNREKVIDIPPQKCITPDNVAIEVYAVVYLRNV